MPSITRYLPLAKFKGKPELFLSVASVFDEFGEEKFYEQLSLFFEDALHSSRKLRVDLDNTDGYSAAFLEATFGKLTDQFGKEKVLSTLVFKSDDEPLLPQEITILYIRSR